jgi:membrane-bound lytic murein transglycosylase F
MRGQRIGWGWTRKAWRRGVHAWLALLVGAGAVTACERAYVETGDLPALLERGRLRVLLPPRNEEERLPRQGSPLHAEQELVAQFARSQGLEPEWIRVDRFEALIPTLLRGGGDVIASNLALTATRLERIAFSSPLGHVREQLVTRSEDTGLRSPKDLAGRRVAARRSSSFWETLESLQARVPDMELVALPENVDSEEALYRVANGELDLTVADSNVVEQALLYLPQLRVAFDLGEGRAIGWGLRPGTPQLRKALNRFLDQAQLTRARPGRYREDLPGIRERQVLRVLTRNSASTYFIWRGELRGFEYDLVRRFADRQGLRLEMVVPPTRAALIPWLLEGRGDLIAAGLTILPERRERGIAFSRPYHAVSETVVARAGDRGLRGPEDLEGRRLVVRRSSSYWTTLERLRAEGIDFELVAAPEALETEEIIERVADGEYDLTVADSHIVAIELSWRDDIQAAFTLGDPVSHGWAARDHDRELLEALNAFLRREYRGTFYNVIYARYFGDRQRVRGHAEERAARSGRLSPFDELARRHAEQHGFDWRLVVAQMYQESRFDPQARSPAGALGLMQVLPRTGRELGIEDLEDPNSGLRAGVTYLKRLYDRFEGRVADRERIWFALAAYNAGYGHVRDGRRLAKQVGHDPDLWFQNVARSIPLLARRKYHQNARFGYCRCIQAVRYVREIRARYRAYRDATGTAQLF